MDDGFFSAGLLRGTGVSSSRYFGCGAAATSLPPPPAPFGRLLGSVRSRYNVLSFSPRARLYPIDIAAPPDPECRQRDRHPFFSRVRRDVIPVTFSQPGEFRRAAVGSSPLVDPVSIVLWAGLKF